jgi:serine/threonine-protein kinase
MMFGGAEGTPQPMEGGGKEELRGTLLRPYLLRLRGERGEAACRALCATVGLPESVLDDDGVWISTAAAKRALDALTTALGPEAIASRGEWATHPATLSSYVRLLRIASTVPEAYEHLCKSSLEADRVGRFEIERAGRNQASISYLPRDEAPGKEHPRLLCIARQAELRSLPRLWGLSDANVTEDGCLSAGQKLCRYNVSWPEPSRHRNAPIGALTGAAVCGASVSLSGSVIAAATAALLGGVLGGAVGWLRDRMRQEQAARVFERHRIAALERGLELRGELRAMPGELVGAVLGGKYRIKQSIGTGGIGTVYAAEHVALGGNVAIKVLRGAAAADAAEIARLRREARVQVFVEHPNVVKTFDLDQMPDGSIYVVMELLEGATLSKWLKSVGPLPGASVIRAFTQVCRALDAAHAAGIVHRDMKPGNIFLCDDGSVKVLDFGMSKLSDGESLTQQGYTLGTPEYMSPEQCVGGRLDGRSDIYSLGIVMYEALTGSLPFRPKNRRELMKLHQQQTPESLRQRRPDLAIPPALEQAVLSCLKKSPGERPSSASELEMMLERSTAESSKSNRRA